MLLLYVVGLCMLPFGFSEPGEEFGRKQVATHVRTAQKKITSRVLPGDQGSVDHLEDAAHSPDGKSAANVECTPLLTEVDVGAFSIGKLEKAASCIHTGHISATVHVECFPTPCMAHLRSGVCAGAIDYGSFGVWEAGTAAAGVALAAHKLRCRD
jgi:hypothetical protein